MDELENNDESFMNENTSLLKDMKDQEPYQFENDVNISCNFHQNQTMTEEESTYINMLRNNLLGIINPNLKPNLNKSFMLPQTKKVMFNVSSSQTKFKSNNKNLSNNNMSQIHSTILNNTTVVSNSFTFNMSTNENPTTNNS